MIEPQLAKPGESPGFGLGFAISTLDKSHRRIGHGGAVYGFATEVQALPDAKLGAIVIATADCANGFTQHVAETALRMMLSEGPAVAHVWSRQRQFRSARLAELAGRYTREQKLSSISSREAASST